MLTLTAISPMNLILAAAASHDKILRRADSLSAWKSTVETCHWTPKSDPAVRNARRAVKRLRRRTGK